MNDKELVDVWRKEFLSLIDKNTDIPKSHRNNYWTNIIDDRWQGFLMAKRTQQSVVLPKITQRHSANYIDGVQDCKACITAAGIKYTIGE